MYGVVNVWIIGYLGKQLTCVGSLAAWGFFAPSLSYGLSSTAIFLLSSSLLGTGPFKSPKVETLLPLSEQVVPIVTADSLYWQLKALTILLMMTVHRPARYRTGLGELNAPTRRCIILKGRRPVASGNPHWKIGKAAEQNPPLPGVLLSPPRVEDKSPPWDRPRCYSITTPVEAEIVRDD